MLNLKSFIIKLLSRIKNKSLDAKQYEGLLENIEAMSPEQYKHALGLLLAKGLDINKFDYPTDIWPPPTPARKYIKTFLDTYQDEVRGRCVEFNPPVYKEMFISNSKVASYDVWNIEAGNGITIVSNLQNADNIEDDSFDTIICTHVLSAIPNLYKSVSEMKRVLSSNGLLLCTVPTILQKYAPDPKDCWRFTVDSLREILSGFKKVELHSYGNAATVVGSPYYLMTNHFPERIMAYNDENCPSIIAAAAWK